MVNISGGGRHRSKRMRAIGMIVFATVLIGVTGCFGGSQEDDSEATVTRSSRARDTSDDRARASSRETVSVASHAEPAPADHEAVSTSNHESGSGAAVPVSLTTAPSDDAHGVAESSDDATPVDGAQEEDGHGPAHWEYTGAVGQNYWGLLEESFNSCVDGSAQSPIDIRDTLVSDLQDIAFHYNPARLVVSNNGHTIQASYGLTDQGDGGFMIVDGQEFQLLQFHFHRPSEHTVNGHQAAMEMHLVHAAEDGTLAVVGVLIEPGAYNSVLEPVWDVMPGIAGTEVVMEALVDVDQLLPRDRRTYRYPGSLTTPPCSEGVKWNLMKTPISVSTGQVDAFKDLYFFNARYTQPLNGRVILEDAAVEK